MDVSRFINSKDIREYLSQTDYRFNTLEAAYLIYACRFLTMREKHDAWDELIDTMPDMAWKLLSQSGIARKV